MNNFLHYTALLISIFLISVSTIAADREAIIAKINALPHSDTAKTNLYTDLFYQYVYSAKQDSSLIIAETGLRLAQEQGFTRGIGTQYRNLGVYYDALGKYDRAIDCFLKAVPYYQQANYVSGIARVYYHMSRIYDALKDPLTSEYYINLTVKLSESQKNEEVLFLAGMHRVRKYLRSNQPDSALILLNKGEHYYKSSNDSVALSWHLVRWAEYYHHLKEHEKSIQVYKKAIEIFINTNSDYGIFSAYLGIANNYMVMPGKEDKAIQVYNQILNQQNTYDFNTGRLIDDCLLKLSEIYEQRRDYQKAYQYLRGHVKEFSKKNEYKDSVQLQSLHTQAELTQKELELQHLQSEVELGKLNLENEKLSRKIVYLSGSVLIFILLLILVLYYFNYKSNKLLSATNKIVLKQNEKLKQANEEIRGLIDILSHDLKAPFHRIKGLVSIFDRGKDSVSNEDFEMIIQKLSQSVNQGLHLISELLELNRLEQGMEAYAAEEINGKEFFDEIFHSLQDMSLAKNIQLKHTYRSDIEYFTLNKMHLRRIIENLAGNAIKFTKIGKSVTISAVIEFGVLQISVDDEGPGIPQSEQHLLFKKFARLSVKPTGEESSTGLGLYSVKLMTEALNGTVLYQPKATPGSLFVLTVPLIN